MKYVSFVFLLFIIAVFTVIAQPVNAISVNKVAAYILKPPEAAFLDATTYLPPSVRAGHLKPEAFPKNSTELEYNKDRTTTIPHLVKRDAIYLEFYDTNSNKMRLGDVGLVKIQVECETRQVEYNIPSTEDSDSQCYILYLTSEKMASFIPNSLMKLSLFYSDDSQDDRYFYFKAWASLYSIGDVRLGLWFPVSIFGTDFGLTPSGLGFVAMPVTLAWGVQVFPFNSTLYFGLNAGVGLAWATNLERASVPTTNPQAFFLSKLAIHMFLDLGGYGYFGCCPVIDWTTDPIDVGLIWLIGVGPKLLDILQ